MAKSIATFIVLILCFVNLAMASDPMPLQDFCVAESSSSVHVNGLTCKDPAEVGPGDFFYSGLNEAGNTSNPLGSFVQHVFVDVLPGLNTLGVGIARIDLAPNGLNAPHIHPRATELLTVMEGTLEVGFITSNPENRLFTKTLQKGDAFVFPVGLIHFQRNVGEGNAAAISMLNSQSPGVVIVADSVFGSEPLISGDVLSKAFQVDKNVVGQIQSKF